MTGTPWVLIETAGSSSTFGQFAPASTYPWLRFLDADTAILGLDPTRPGLTARGRLPELQLELTKELIAGPGRTIRRLIVACHYPVEVPPPYRQDLVSKNLINAESLGRWLATIGPHLYCCGHVHATWAFLPDQIPGPALSEPGCALAARPHRPAAARFSRDSADGARRDRQSPRMDERGMADSPSLPGAIVLSRNGRLCELTEPLDAQARLPAIDQFLRQDQPVSVDSVGFQSEPVPIGGRMFPAALGEKSRRVEVSLAGRGTSSVPRPLRPTIGPACSHSARLASN